MELIKLKYKYTLQSGLFYECDITDKLNEITERTNSFIICNKGLEYIYRIQYNNISIGDFICDRDPHNLCNNVVKFTLYTGNLEFINPRLSNHTINKIYSYLKSLENNICFNK